jgi:ATP-binding cassette subfamily B protein
LISFEQVTFGYQTGRPVLENLSLSVSAGETVAIVGATGAGKSTIIKLLPRLYDPQAGAIRVGGVDVRTIDRQVLRRRVVVVSQDVFMFSGTLRENIALGAGGDTVPGDEEILAAAARVGADRLIAGRPEGLDAPVLERGANFSAGEKQIVAFARALVRRPEILVLDEATASVDPESERLIERGIEELMRDRSFDRGTSAASQATIVIAHRLSTVRRASRIVVLHHGKVAEEGTHDALLAAGGMYARLYRLQMTGHGAAAARPGLDAAE